MGTERYHEVSIKELPATFNEMTPLQVSRNYLQLKGYTRLFISYRYKWRESAEDYSRAVLRNSRPFATTPKQLDLHETLDSSSSKGTETNGHLHGKKVIVTGASRGIGAAIAQRFAQEGAKCVLVGRNFDALTHVKKGLIGPHKGDHVIKVGDVGALEFWKDVARSEVSCTNYSL